MKAARWHNRRDVRIEDVPECHPQPGQVKLKVHYCGICGTDIHEYLEGPMFIAKDPHPLTGYGAPVIIGHEFAGEIIELGEGVTGWAIGDRVAPEGYYICHTCYYCQRHEYNRCERLAFHGFSAPGGLAETVCVPTYQLYPLDPRVSWEEAALVEPTAVAVRAVNHVKPLLGERALVVGAGPIGLAVVQVLRAAGISHIAVVEPARMRREMALALGATIALDPQTDDIEREIANFTGRLGADIAFECGGNDAAYQTTVRNTRKGARICLVSQTNAPFRLFVNEIGFNERVLIGTVAYCGEFAPAIQLIAEGKVRAGEMITARIGLEQLVDVGYRELMEHTDQHVKIIVSPNA